MTPIRGQLRLGLGQEGATSAPSFRLHLVYQGQGH
jgi:hypothetical protein